MSDTTIRITESLLGCKSGRVSSKHENLSNTPKNDSLVFAELPGGGHLRYTDESRQTFRYIPKEYPRGTTGPLKGWTDTTGSFKQEFPYVNEKLNWEEFSYPESPLERLVAQAKYICEAPTPCVEDIDELRKRGKAYAENEKKCAKLAGSRTG
jgi:hypothetical protein